MTDPAANYRSLPLVHETPDQSSESDQEGQKESERQRKEYTHQNQMMSGKSHRGQKVPGPISHHLAQVPVDEPAPVIFLHRRMEEGDKSRHHEEAPLGCKSEAPDLLYKIIAVGLNDITNRGKHHQPANQCYAQSAQETGKDDGLPGRPPLRAILPPDQTAKTDQTEKEQRVDQDPGLGCKPGTSSRVTVGEPDYVYQSAEQWHPKSSCH